MKKQYKKLVHRNHGTDFRHSVLKYIEGPYCANRRIALLINIFVKTNSDHLQTNISIENLKISVI